MNIQGKINKLLVALRTKGRIVGMNTKQFYATDSEKMITKYIIGEINEQAETDMRIIKALYKKINSKKTPQAERKKLEKEVVLLEGEYSEKYISGIFYSKVKILLFLAEWYKKVGDIT